MGLLDGMRIVESAAFIAGPFASMSLAELGADVIRIDPPGGGVDSKRWPVNVEGASLYWAGLNKGKRSVCIDIGQAEGQELATALITAPGEAAGLFVTNFPATGWLSYGTLAAGRSDLIMLNVVGSRDGTTALDYTVNCATGFPLVTGAGGAAAPTNHVLPAWDLVTAMTAATGLLAAERHRRLTGRGQLVRLALADVAMAVTGSLGYIAEVQVNGRGREPVGNHIYGAFGRDFGTRDGRRVMVAAITVRQWRTLERATDLAASFAAIASRAGLNLDLEGDRYQLRDPLAAELEPWFAARSFDEVRQVFNATGVCWGPYQTFEQLVRHDPRGPAASPIFAEVDHPGRGRFLTSATPLEFTAVQPVPPRPAPVLGQHTDEVLLEVLGLSSSQLGDLHGRGIVGGAPA